MQYRFIQWAERYEVDARGGEWAPGKKVRKAPLSFVRLAVHGKAQGVGWRKLLERAGPDKTLQVFGLFC